MLHLSKPRKSDRAISQRLCLLFILIIGLAAVTGCEGPASTRRSSSADNVSAPVQNPIEEALRQPPVDSREGVVAAILIDTSGSMKEKVKDADGALQSKISIAQRAALNLVNQFETYAKAHSDQTIYLGIYEFSERGRGPSCRTVVKLGPPDADAARSAIANMHTDGDTPIGNALIMAKREIDATGFSKRHILVITDGQNTTGYAPEEVTRVISRQDDKDRASIYFVAFDVEAAKFNPVKESGGLVLGASNETDLKGTLDYLLTGKILAEQPANK